jgi:signal peptidase I
VSKDSTDEVNFAAVSGKAELFCFEWIELISQSLIVVAFVMAFAFRPFTIDGSSMRDTLYDRDKVIVKKWDFVPHNGDVVVIRRYRELDAPIIKRVIATEGQELEIDFQTGSVFVNGEKLNENYIKEPMRRRGDAEIPKVIPKGFTFVMGDNRNNSTDSRWNMVGLVDNSYIVGKAVCVYFPFYRIGMIR